MSDWAVSLPPQAQRDLRDPELSPAELRDVEAVLGRLAAGDFQGAETVGDCPECRRLGHICEECVEDLDDDDVN